MLPKFLLADNSDLPGKIFIIHTDFPRFVLEAESEEVEWFDKPEAADREEATRETANLIQAALDFYGREIRRYEEME